MFSDEALRLCAVAARTLGWTPDVFWAATPAELAACLALPAPDGAPPSRAVIAQMIERDRDGR